MYRVLLCAIPVLLAACSSTNSNPPDGLGAGLSSQEKYTYKGGRSDSGRYGPNGVAGDNAFKASVGDLVYFSSDSSDLTPESQKTLAAQAAWLRQYSSQTITVEGHADERGTREYNIALGARRAAAVKTALTSNGVNAARIRTISYGKERPVKVCDDISCWSQNRRAQTVLGSSAISQK